VFLHQSINSLTIAKTYPKIIKITTKPKLEKLEKPIASEELPVSEEKEVDEEKVDKQKVNKKEIVEKYAEDLKRDMALFKMKLLRLAFLRKINRRLHKGETEISEDFEKFLKTIRKNIAGKDVKNKYIKINSKFKQNPHSIEGDFLHDVKARLGTIDCENKIIRIKNPKEESEVKKEKEDENEDN